MYCVGGTQCIISLQYLSPCSQPGLSISLSAGAARLSLLAAPFSSDSHAKVLDLLAPLWATWVGAELLSTITSGAGTGLWGNRGDLLCFQCNSGRTVRPSTSWPTTCNQVGIPLLERQLCLTDSYGNNFHLGSGFGCFKL